MEVKLIEAVRLFPCLWQVTNPSYKDLRARQNAWIEVASQVKLILLAYVPVNSRQSSVTITVLNYSAQRAHEEFEESCEHSTQNLRMH